MIAALIPENGLKVQKIYSSASAICLYCREVGATHYIYIGRGGQCVGLGVYQGIVPSRYRVKDKFLELMRGEFKNWRLVNSVWHEKEKMCHLQFLKKDQAKDFYYIPSGNELYFCICHTHERNQKKTVLKSWEGKRKEVLEIPDPLAIYQDFIKSIKKRDFEKDSSAMNSDKAFGIYLIKSSRQVIKKKIKFLKRKITNISQDLETNKKWRKLYEIADSKVDLGNILPPHFLVEGVKIRVDGSEGQGKIYDLIYSKAKRLRKGEGILSVRLDQARSELASLLDGEDLEEIETAYKRYEAPVWKDMSRSEKLGRAHQKDIRANQNEVDFFKVGEFSGGIGKSAKGNDFLRSWGNKDDMWLHIDNEEGCHVVLRIQNLLELNSIALTAIAGAIAHYSGVKRSEVNLVYSEVGGIKGIKGRPGAVTIKRPRYLTVPVNHGWQEILSFI